MGNKILELKDVSLVLPKNRELLKASGESVLQNISLGMNEGDSLGVIGSNGSGKSSLLRLMAGIYSPDRGRIIRGVERVALLSLSAGFDEHLSGRDNAVLSSMFLGHSKKNAYLMVDEIKEFSRLGSQFENPVNTYSTGMRARLGFSVAIKMDASIILVDEIIGVGDASFREQAEDALMTKIQDSTAFVLVSHSLEQISKLCKRTIWLKQGRIEKFGETQSVIDSYESFVAKRD